MGFAINQSARFMAGHGSAKYVVRSDKRTDNMAVVLFVQMAVAWLRDAFNRETNN